MLSIPPAGPPLAGVVVLAVTVALLVVQVTERASVALDAAVDRALGAVPGVDVLRDVAARGPFDAVQNVWTYAVVLTATVLLAGVEPAWVNVAAVDPVAAVGAGLAFGVVVYAVGELLGLVLFDAMGFEYDASERAAMTPDDAGHWVGFLAVTLPLGAYWEELVFRGVLVGVAAATLPVSTWVVAVASIAVFGWIHRYMGTGAVLLTAGMGAVLTAAFVLGASLPLLVVAHATANAVEFLVHETVLAESLPTGRSALEG